MVLGYIIFRFKSWDGLSYFSSPFQYSAIDARGTAARTIKSKVTFPFLIKSLYLVLLDIHIPQPYCKTIQFRKIVNFKHAARVL